MGHCDHDDAHAPEGKRRIDWMLAIVTPIIILGYGGHYLLRALEITVPYVSEFAVAVVALTHKMWWGVLLGMVAVGILSRLPQKAIVALLGTRRVGGIIRATLGGVLLDLCSHGILLVGMQLYRRGASLGQTMAFLIASPWNSLSFTLILFSLIGVPWTLAMIGASMVIAILSGFVFDLLVARGTLPENPARLRMVNNAAASQTATGEARQTATNTAAASHKTAATPTSTTATPSPDSAESQPWRAFARQAWKGRRRFSLLTFARDTWGESRMIIRWIGLGLVMAAVIRAAIDVDTFKALFAPTLSGIGLTLLLATILEVCSEGSAPLAADMFTRAAAPGNGFTFLMAGVATDYTELAALKETTGRWKVAFFLPLVTLPQIVAIALLFNG